MSHIAVREERTSIQSVAFGQGAGGGMLAPQNLGDIVRFAEVMARADIAIPKHLRDNPGACLAVCMQAFKWEMDPFSVAQKSYKVGDQMAYEAQLIAAVINTRAGLKRRPQIEYRGDGQDRQCVVTFEASDGSVHVYESPRFAAITTKNSPLWKSDPDQQLGYYSVRAGARRHFPEVILGVYDRDELDGARDITPTQSGRSAFADRIAAQPAQTSQSATEGFRADHIDGELGARPEPQVEAQAPADEIDPDAPAFEHEAALEQEADDREADRTVSSASHDPVLLNLLTECAAKMLEIAAGTQPAKDRGEALTSAKDAWKRELPSNLDDLKKIVDRAYSVITGKLNMPAAVKLIATEVGVDEADIRPAVR
ncbi:recombinase RecT [Aureimonas phyllosphaerae]|uniref:recombinase RecT n=1 Tax=Aureimonas phyllosphaerae TaxID=1166078 RepID=UPI003A5C650E